MNSLINLLSIMQFFIIAFLVGLGVYALILYIKALRIYINKNS